MNEELLQLAKARVIDEIYHWHHHRCVTDGSGGGWNAKDSTRYMNNHLSALVKYKELFGEEPPYDPKDTMPMHGRKVLRVPYSEAS